ncbi:MAG: hypothetical protein ACEQR8_07595 [Cypionkella sp.]
MASRPPEIVPPTDRERARFIALNAVRIGGVALVLLGILIESGRIELPRAVGWAFLAVGLVDVFLVPRLLARRWRTPAP